MHDRTAAAREALDRLARSDPEQPFLFFRSPRGTFTWWSFARAASELGGTIERPPSTGTPTDLASAAPEELLDRLIRLDPVEEARARELLAAVSRPGVREIWISARPLERPEERCLALAGALGGWAVVREPGEALTPALLLWARPTLISGTEDELRTLLRALPGEAPRWRRARPGSRRLASWLAPRLARLSTVLVEAGGSRSAVESELAALALPGAAPRVLPFPGGGW